MTLWQFENCLDGYQKRIETADALNHSLGSYILTAYHEPKKYPREPIFAKSKKQDSKMYQSDEEYERLARIKYGKK